MMDSQTLRKQLLLSWKITSTEDVVNAYSRILEHIFLEPCQNMEHMAFSSFSRIVNDPNIKEATLIELVFHLINIGELLDLKYEFIDDEDSCYRIPKEAVKDAEETGYFYHPATGESVKSYEEKVFMYFTPSKKLRDLKDTTASKGAVE